MGRLVLSWVCVFALVALHVGGCSEESGGAGGSGGTGGTDLCEGIDCDDGNECTEDTCTDGMCDSTPVEDGTSCGDGAGTCQVGSCVGTFACTEQGIRDAIAVGGGPHTFDCDGPQTVVTEAPVVIDNDVILDGEGNLTVDGDLDHTVFFSSGTVTLEGIAVTRGRGVVGGGISNGGTLTLKNCSVIGNFGDPPNMADVVGGAGIGSTGKLTVMNSTISGNTVTGPAVGGGIFNINGEVSIMNSSISGNTADSGGSAGGIFNINGEVSIMNSTISGNTADSIAGGIFNINGEVSIMNSSISGNTADSGAGIACGNALCTIIGSLVDGDCDSDIASNGYNIESPGDTCGFNPGSDQVDVTEGQLNLGPLADNGGPTMTHALLPGSVAIDWIPADMCEVDTDQRGVMRPQGAMCDVGAFEVQP